MAKKPKQRAEPSKSRDRRMNNAYMAWIEDHRKAANIMFNKNGESLIEIARRANVHPNTLKRFLQGKTMAPGADTVVNICAIALDIPMDLSDRFKKRHGI